MELLYACHELKMFNGGEVTLGACGGIRLPCAGGEREECLELLRADAAA